MSHKKPVWTTIEAHDRLKDYCKATGKTQLDVVSGLIMTHLSPDGDSSDGESGNSKKGSKKPMGGVWVL